MQKVIQSAAVHQLATSRNPVPSAQGRATRATSCRHGLFTRDDVIVISGARSDVPQDSAYVDNYTAVARYTGHEVKELAAGLLSKLSSLSEDEDTHLTLVINLLLGPSQPCEKDIPRFLAGWGIELTQELNPGGSGYIQTTLNCCHSAPSCLK